MPVARDAGTHDGGKMLVRLVALGVVVVLVGAAIVGWPQISRQLGVAGGSPTAGVTVPATAARSAAPSEARSPAPSPVLSGAPSKAPSETPSEEPTPTATAAPTASFWTAGHATPEEAIAQFVADQGYIYGGPCATAPASADYCSRFVSTVGQGRVYALGGVGSAAAEAWVLLRQIGGLWYIVDGASAAAGSPAPWH